MIRSIAYLSGGIALTILSAGAASAQATPVPGAGDSTAISSGNRDTNAAYNRLIGAADSRVPKDTGKRAPARSTAVAATAADLKVGSPLRDVNGVHIGTVSQVDADGVIVDTGTTKIKVPAMGFGKDDQGLLLNLTAAHFNELIAKAQAAH